MVIDVYQGRGSEIIKNHSKQVEKNNAKVERQYGGLLNQAMFQWRYGLHSICTATVWFEESYFFSLVVVSFRPQRSFLGVSQKLKQSLDQLTSFQIQTS